ncbi:RidA family protein [Priestia taiwanensis]|uniref:Enamine deaminase RidA n=1 Tax=Priestia taiwanensis TaxID=1347902 RepID=A0A917AKF4_9BACI|nr:RidA family protein [Priestia taiwanensis]MBM7361947.1 enamine deaminase RidA (YjgF/YER057c/UK114 family) [Priestia taiwanensis]GGE58271.1 enamine deaminase RidA [Priestia taiwanensis]
MRNGIITRKNPANMPGPVGNYTHITKIPRNAELFVTSGQIGINQDGQFPESMNEQISNTFQNINKVLESEELTAANIIKVNIWATEEIDWEHMDFEWEKLFHTEYPAMTIGYLSALGLPEIKVELEVWAAKP